MNEAIENKIYERTSFLNEKLFPSNVHVVIIDKMKNSKLTDEFRVTFDYSHVNEQLSEIYLQLSSICHDYLFNFKHECFMIDNFKHEYHIATFHFKSRKHFVFIISELKHLQSTKMQQSPKIAEFIMIELMNRILKALSHPREHSLLQEFNSEISV